MGTMQDQVEKWKAQINSQIGTSEQIPGNEESFSPPLDEGVTNNEGEMDNSGDLDAAFTDTSRETPSRRERKKNHNPYLARIRQLSHEKHLKDQQIRELSEYAHNQQALLNQQASMIDHEKQNRDAYYENNLFTREASIVNELKNAKEEGDIEKEVALSKELAQITADKSTYSLYKNQLAAKASAPEPIYDSYMPPIVEEPVYPVYQEPQSYEPVNEEANAWLEANPWANPNAAEYSPRLRGELEAFASELDETLKYNGHADMIGTPEYFDSLDNLMAERYRVDNDNSSGARGHSSSGMGSGRSRGSVAPVSRRGSSMADQYIADNPNRGRRSVPMSEQEYKIARNLLVKDPLTGGWKPGGDKGLNTYYENVRKVRQSARSNPSGTHYSVTID